MSRSCSVTPGGLCRGVPSGGGDKGTAEAKAKATATANGKGASGRLGQLR